MPLKYYLETNALFSIGKMRADVIPESYTSVFALFELVAGLDDESYSKRKTIIESVASKKIKVDWRMPENILFQNFDALREFEFIDFRANALVRLVQNIKKFDTLQQVIDEDRRDNVEMSFEYFKTVDGYINRTFVSSTVAGNKNLKQQFAELRDIDPLVINDKTYSIETHQGLSELLSVEENANISMTILAFANNFLSDDAKGSGITEEMMYNSYNHNSDGFMRAYTKRVTSYTIERNIPKRNDINDLLHLLYIPQKTDVKIVSDDKIFKAIVPEKQLDISTLK